MEKYATVTCKYYAILYKGLEHPQILVSLVGSGGVAVGGGFWNGLPPDTEGHLCFHIVGFRGGGFFFLRETALS